MRPARASRTAGNRSLSMRGFTTYPQAPTFRQARTMSGSECTVKKTTLAREPDSFNCSAASMPPRIGMEISVIITSGCNLRAVSTRALPLSTVPLTSKVGSSIPFTSSRTSVVIRHEYAHFAHMFCRYETSQPCPTGPAAQTCFFFLDRFTPRIIPARFACEHSCLKSRVQEAGRKAALRALEHSRTLATKTTFCWLFWNLDDERAYRRSEIL